MAEPSVATFSSTTDPNLSANRVNQKTFIVSGTHDAVVTTITTSATISGITAPCYLVNASTGEIIYAEGISGATFTTCTRGADGTSGQPLSTGQILHAILVANDINQIIREILAIATYARNADPLQVESIASVAAQRVTKSDGQINHANLYNVDSTNYTHLSAASHTDLTDGGATTLHKHDHGGLDGLADDDHTQYHNDTRGDARYFTEAEHLSTSAGATDAGKPVKLDADGNIDATMINDTDIDHDAITNFVADEHLPSATLILMTQVFS